MNFLYKVSQNMANLGRLVKEYRERHPDDLKQRHVAEMCDISTSVVTRWERGESRISWKHWDKLIECLHIPRQRFLTIAQEEWPEGFRQYNKHVKHLSEPNQQGSIVLWPESQEAQCFLAWKALPARERTAIKHLMDAFHLHHPRITTHLINQIDLLLELEHHAPNAPPPDGKKKAQ